MKAIKYGNSAGRTLAVVLGIASLTVPARACELAIVWKASLSSSAKASAGTAAIQFDFAHPGATVQVDTKNLQDVRQVELHVSRSYSDHTGPTVIKIYTAADGPWPAMLTRRVTEADLQKQSSPKITSFSDLVQAVLNGRAYVTIATKSHPEGEYSGFVTMHKEEIYSDSPADPAHDAALHRKESHSPITAPAP